MNNITLDIESFSSVDIGKSGVYRYAESPDFEILLFACSVDGQPVQVYDLACGEKVPDEILKALTDEKIIKHSFNASFERICLSRYLGLPSGTYLSPEGWRCDMVWAATLGLPQSLEGVGAVLGLEKQKLTEGKDLTRYFCRPCAPTQSNGGRTRNLPGMLPTSGRCSSATTSGTWRPRWKSSGGSPNTRYRTSCGRNTSSTRRSTTGAFSWTWSWCVRRYTWMPDPGKNS
ncbi:hypothetical protein [Succinimonas amylolytica]|uniref:hypothetical protein n=1 Tax=Succinimonas amylolytica TaxID=83769 RepID=UPI0003A27BE9|nr:hypothetical protein [Succinimonas amylolytica]